MWGKNKKDSPKFPPQKRRGNCSSRGDVRRGEMATANTGLLHGKKVLLGLLSEAQKEKREEREDLVV